MRIPVIKGVIRRRILVNYRADPEVVARLLPPRMQPKLFGGHAWVGICLIRLEHVRPRGVPRLLGIRSENAAHRVAVEWPDDSGCRQQGVFVQRRDTSARVNSWAGGRVFPGEHHLARFEVVDDGSHVAIAMHSNDGQVSVNVAGDGTGEWSRSSAFASPHDASEFFRRASLGYSPSRTTGRLDGLLLDIPDWQAQPLAVRSTASSYFDDERNFPRGTIEFDHALVMRDVLHEWRGAASLCTN